VDENETLPPEKEKWTVTTTDSAGQSQRWFLKPPKGHSEAKRNSWAEKNLEDIIGVTTGGPQGRRKDDVGHTEENYRIFADFIRSMLIYQPLARVSAKDALSHAYVLANIEYPSQGSGTISSSTTTPTSTKESDNQADDQSSDKKSGGILPQTSDQSSDSSGGAVLPRRRCRSAPRLTSNDFFQKSSSQSAEARKGASKNNEEGDVTDEHSSKKLATSGTSDNQDNKPHGMEKSDSQGPMETSEVDDDGNMGSVI
jgi:serine/threonine protein kinase